MLMPEKMKAAVYSKPGLIDLVENPVPQVDERKVLIKVFQSGICGGDLKRFKGEFPPPKYTDGHEFSGVVAQVGSSVDGVQEGERVIVKAFRHCGNCRFCRCGLYQLCEQWEFLSNVCHGGYGEYALVDAGLIFPLSSNLSFEEGALVEPLAVACHALRRAAIDYPEDILIIGGGTIGLFSIAVAYALGLRPSCMVKYLHQAEVAQAFGIKKIYLLSQDEPPRNQFSVVIETTASERALNQALISVRKGGKIILVGSYSNSVPVRLDQLIDRELEIMGSLCYGQGGIYSDYEMATRLIEDHMVDFTRVITHRFSLAEINRAFQVAADKHSGAIKVHLIFNT
ncbi:MAG: alcohol dehydrogenase catalytic domain-containing protein [Firmicutes bacterium]|nr:alcohol dehydrogenase catalytic domain-containing protein [Bacillota bacterium]